MIYNFTKCESVIAKIMADSDSTETRLRVTDIREWIFEAIEKIGAPVLYINKETPTIKIEDNQIPMPDDLINLDGVAYKQQENSRWIPVKKRTGIFMDLEKGNKKPIVELVYDDSNYVVDEHYIVKREHQHMMNKLPTTQSKMIHGGIRILENANKHKMYGKDPEYFLKPGWLVINKKEGFVKLAYKAIAVDERGYPLIPDLASYQEAIYWYVMMKLSFPKYLKGSLGGKGVNTGANLYNYMETQWSHFRNMAYSEAMMPTADDMQNIKKEWNNLMFDFNENEKFFKDLNEQQTFYHNYYHGY